MNEEIEKLIMSMISFGGQARSSAFEAIEKAKLFEFDEAERILNVGKEAVVQGQKAHLKLLEYEANNDDFKITALYVHGADYVSSGDDLLKVAETLVYVLKKQEG